MKEQIPIDDFERPSCASCPEWSSRVIELMGLEDERDRLKQLQSERIDELLSIDPENPETVRFDPEIQDIEQQISALTTLINGLYEFIDVAPILCKEPKPKLFGRGALRCTTRYRDR